MRSLGTYQVLGRYGSCDLLFDVCKNDTLLRRNIKPRVGNLILLIHHKRPF